MNFHQVILSDSILRIHNFKITISALGKLNLNFFHQLTQVLSCGFSLPFYYKEMCSAKFYMLNRHNYKHHFEFILKISRISKLILYKKTRIHNSNFPDEIHNKTITDYKRTVEINFFYSKSLV